MWAGLTVKQVFGSFFQRCRATAAHFPFSLTVWCKILEVLQKKPGQFCFLTKPLDHCRVSFPLTVSTQSISVFVVGHDWCTVNRLSGDRVWKLPLWDCGGIVNVKLTLFRKWRPETQKLPLSLHSHSAAHWEGCIDQAHRSIFSLLPAVFSNQPWFSSATQRASAQVCRVDLIIIRQAHIFKLWILPLSK